MKLCIDGLTDQSAWHQIGIALPRYDVRAAAAAAMARPQWVHFGAGNIFRAFIARLQQTLLNEGLCDTGIIAVETFDFDVIDRIYTPYDNLALLVGLKPDGTTDREVLGSIAAGLKTGDAEHMAKLRRIFADPSLQMASFTITEKGYGLAGLDGALLPVVQADLKQGPDAPVHAMSIVTALMLARFKAGACPMALVSMDNCSHNGEKLREAVLTIARGWAQAGFVPNAFVAYLADEDKVSFPWSMIDKITPRPDKAVQAMLEGDGVENMAPVVTEKNTYIAAYVNAEIPEYLVVEDRFPNGRPPLERAGVFFTDRETVNNSERMKVTTCLNPLHTALAVFGCLLGYTRISDEMADADLKRLVERIGYQEGLPVVVNPGILDPEAFLREVLEVRFPNPFIPDTPQRIATDTSLKIPIRFGETILAYIGDPNRDPRSLIGIPLALAGWLRYLLGVDDEGNPMQLSPDPMHADLQAALQGIVFGRPESVDMDGLTPLLSNAAVFGTDLTACGLAQTVIKMLREMTAGPGAVRRTLRQSLSIQV